MKTVKIFILLFFVGLFSCSSTEMMTSNSAKKIVIDGNHEDWNGKLKFFKDEKLAVGFQNDKENLYFCLVTSDRQTAMKIMLLGLTVWFEPEKDNPKIGLRYPRKLPDISPRSLKGMMGNKNGKNDFDITISTLMQNQGEFALVNDDEQIIYSSPIGNKSGYLLKIAGNNQQFVYEAKIPIGNNSLAEFPINIFPGEKTEIELETGEFDMSEMSGGREGMHSGGMGMGQGGGMSGDGSGRGGMRGGGQGGRGGNASAFTEKLDLDIELKLAD